MYVPPAIGLVLCALLAIRATREVLVGLCDGQARCGHVQESPFASLLGIPLVFWGLAGHTASLVLLRCQHAWVAPFASMLAGAEVYLLWVMYALLEEPCTLCLVHAGIVFAWAGMTLRLGGPGGAAPDVGWVSQRGLLPVTALLSFFLLAEPVRTAFAREAQSSAARLATPTQAGEASASTVLEVFSSFTCSHCRALERTLEAFRRAHPEVLLQFRDLVRPGDRRCESATECALSAALAAGPAAYLEVRERLLSSPVETWDVICREGSHEEARARARTLLEFNRRRALALGIVATPTLVLRRDGRLTTIEREQPDLQELERLLGVANEGPRSIDR